MYNEFEIVPFTRSPTSTQVLRPPRFNDTRVPVFRVRYRLKRTTVLHAAYQLCPPIKHKR